MTITPGLLAININTAVLTRSTEMFGKMNPFCQVVIGTQLKRTTTHKKGGKNPNFRGEVLEFDVTNEMELKISIYDEEKIKAHDLVGEAVFNILEVTKGELKQKPIELNFKGKMVGTVYVDFDFKSRMGQLIGKKLLSGLGIGAAAGLAPGLGAAAATTKPEVKAVTKA